MVNAQTQNFKDLRNSSLWIFWKLKNISRSQNKNEDFRPDQGGFLYNLLGLIESPKIESK